MKMETMTRIEAENLKAPNEMAFLRIDVGSMNKPLQPVVKDYNALELLARVHPMHRSYHAGRLYNKKVIDQAVRIEFSGSPWGW